MLADITNVYAPIAARAASEPGRLAVVTPRFRISFSRLDAAVAKAAHLLLSTGLAEGQRAGISAAENLLHLVLALALARIGVAQVALPAADTPDLHASVARDLGLASIIRRAPKRGDEPAWQGVPSVAIEPAALFNREPPPAVATASSRDLVWLILKSSGTTGSAKYAELSHAAAVLRSRRYGPMFDCGADDVFWPLSTVDLVVAKQRTLFCLQRGAAVCLPEGLRTVAEHVQFVNGAGVTLACGSPFHMNLLLAAFPHGVKLPALRAFEARSATISERLRKNFRQLITDKLYVVYASNEADSITLASPELQAGIPETVGLPVDGVTVEVVDDEDRPLPTGQVGQVRVKGPGVVGAYLNNSEATARSFRDGWLYPGDLASTSAAGALLLHGRTDDMMAFDGIKIYPAEIENVLMDHAAVADAAAFPIYSKSRQHIPSAAVVVRSPISEAELISHCRSWLGVKAPVCVMILDSLPRNAMGKILKRQLSEEARRRLTLRASAASATDTGTGGAG